MAVHVVALRNQHDHRRALPEMFKARRSRYREGVGWSGVAGDDGRDADRFDHDAAVYLLDLASEGRLQAACRLIPVAADHPCRMALAAAAAPVAGTDILDLGRWMAMPGTRDGACAGLACAAMEYATRRRVTGFVAMGTRDWFDELAGYGWPVCHVPGDERLARVEAGEHVLSRTRAATGIRAPVLIDIGDAVPVSGAVAIPPAVRRHRVAAG